MNRYVDCPENAPKRNFLLQTMKVALFIIEFNLVALSHKMLKRKKLVILERSLVDLYVHPERYGINFWLIEKFRPLLIDWYADLNILLTGDAHLIEKRKK